MELSPKYVRAIQASHYNKGESVEIIAKRTGLPEAEIQGILSEPDPLTDFVVYKFGKLTRDLYEKAVDTLESVDTLSLGEATLSAKATLLKSLLDQMQKAHSQHVIHMDQSDDFKLARLLSLGREDARAQLMERFTSLAHALFGGMEAKEVTRQMQLMRGESPDAPSNPKAREHPSEADPLLRGAMPKLRLVGLGGGDSVQGETNTADSSGSPGIAQGIGAFRGVKESKPS